MRLWLVLPGLLAPTMALAGDAPAALDSTFARSAAACTPGGGEGGEIEDFLTVAAEGVFGYEFGCRFLDFHGISYDGETHQFIAIGQCSDDSGIYRPDNFSLVFNDDGASLALQSQNEYVAGEDFASGTYVRCD